MTALISRAIASGYTQKQILDYIIRKFPQHKDVIQSAVSMGFTPNQVIKYMSGGRKEVNRSDEGEEALTEHEQVTQAEQKTKSNKNKGALAVGATLAGLGLSRAIPAAAGFLGQQSTATPTSPAPPQPGPLPIRTGPNPMPPIGPGQGANIPQPGAPQQPMLPPPQGQSGTLPGQAPNVPQQMPKAAEILDQFGLRQMGEKLRMQGKSPEIIRAVLGKSLKGDQLMKYNEMVQNGDVPSFNELIDQFISEPPTMQYSELPPDQQRKFGGLLEPVEPSGFNPEDSQVPEENRPAVKRGSMVIKPDGSIGEVKGQDKSGMLVEGDGKAKKYSEEDLIQSPLEEKDLADLYDDLISGIEKKTGKQVSRNVEWAGYDPKTNELGYKPHGSDKIYSYEDIPPEDVEMLTSLLTQRKSTGENFIGAWEAGTESPIGAAMFQLIKKLQAQRGGKGNEYHNRYETIYDAIEPAKLAAKRRHAERKKEAKKSGLA